MKISTRNKNKGNLEIYPKFIINNKSSDLMIRGGDFYAVWIKERGLWSTDEQDVVHLIDEELDKYFYTYSKRKFENMDILDKDLKQELKIAYENTSRGFIFRITQNKIYINFRTENIFDDNIFSKFLNEKTLLEQYCLLDSIYKLANNTVRIVKKIDNKNLYK